MFKRDAQLKQKNSADANGGISKTTFRNNFRTVYSGGKSSASASANELEVEDLELEDLDNSL